MSRRDGARRAVGELTSRQHRSNWMSWRRPVPKGRPCEGGEARVSPRRTEGSEAWQDGNRWTSANSQPDKEWEVNENDAKILTCSGLGG